MVKRLCAPCSPKSNSGFELLGGGTYLRPGGKCVKRADLRTPPVNRLEAKAFMKAFCDSHCGLIVTRYLAK